MSIKRFEKSKAAVDNLKSFSYGLLGIIDPDFINMGVSARSHDLLYHYSPSIKSPELYSNQFPI